MTSFEADYEGACVRPSPNHGERVDGRRPDMILLHYTGMRRQTARSTGSVGTRARFPAIISCMRMAR